MMTTWGGVAQVQGRGRPDLPAVVSGEELSFATICVRKQMFEMLFPPVCPKSGSTFVPSHDTSLNAKGTDFSPFK